MSKNNRRRIKKENIRFNLIAWDLMLEEYRINRRVGNRYSPFY